MSSTKIIKLAQAENPKEAIFKAVGNIGKLDIFHNQILIGTYIEPEKTKGGLILPQSRQTESRFQSKVGLVLKKGPLAFKDEGETKFYGQNVEVGDWVFYRASDGLEIFVNDVPCRVLTDLTVRGRIPSPDYIW